MKTKISVSIPAPALVRAFILFMLMISLPAGAQYFGRNKPSYRVFDFNVYQTPNFEIYHYLDNDSVLKMIASRSEAWYNHHQAIFRDTIIERNPLLIYETHAEFQQTTAVSGMLGESTGGVTEAFKNRVIMPLFPSFAQTDHIIGHELVHAFQFNILTSSDSLNLSRISNLPLWMVEGMAEYFSIGSVDPHTAMWMRDAVLSNDIPTIRDMTRSYRYFPYRYGQAVIAMIGKTWGDSTIIKLFRETAKSGHVRAFTKVLGFDDKTFSGMWKSAMETHYKPLLTDTIDRQTGRKILFGKNAGKMNLSPSVSPDGKYVVFLSERDVFSLDLFLADARTGRVIRKLSSRVNRNEIDALSFLESAGTWAPDGKHFAFVVFSEGKNKLIIMNVERRRSVREIEVPGLPAINNPAWSPDGRFIALSAMKDGASDIFLYEVETDSVRRLTRNSYAKLQPTWSPDGKYIAYATDRPLPGQEQRFRHDFYNIGIIEVGNQGNEKLLELFTGARNMNPLFSPDGNSLYFLSDRDGFRNLYRYDTTADTLFQMTRYMRGITGITAHSPAVSIARETGDLIYSYYSERTYSIFSAGSNDFKEFPVSRYDLDYTAATLPPAEYVAQNLVDKSLLSEFSVDDIPVSEFKPVPYRPRFRLDYLTNTSVGVASGRMGTGMAGSVSAIFGDMTGDNQIYSSLALNGEIYDFGGLAAYINQKRRLKWGASLSHVPYYFGTVAFGIDSLTIGGEPVLVNKMDLTYLRMFEDKASLFAFYPFSQTRRVEFSGEIAAYSYRTDLYTTYYDLLGYPLGSDRKKLESPDGFSLGKVDAAYVVDNSIFGMTGPVSGTRYRIEAGKYFGAVDNYTTLADYRRYFHIRPATLAFRSYNYGRWGGTPDNDLLTPLYIGYPWMVRGYQRMDAYYTNMQTPGQGIGYDNFFGSRIFVANAELRIPFTGPENISLIKSELFFTDINLFIDGGLAMDKGSRIAGDWYNPGPGEKAPVFSYGASLRLNLFGYLVLEPYYAVPVRKGTGPLNGTFGINFTPGW